MVSQKLIFTAMMTFPNKAIQHVPHIPCPRPSLCDSIAILILSIEAVVVEKQSFEVVAKK